MYRASAPIGLECRFLAGHWMALALLVLLVHLSDGDFIVLTLQCLMDNLYLSPFFLGLQIWLLLYQPTMKGEFLSPKLLTFKSYGMI